MSRPDRTLIEFASRFLAQGEAVDDPSLPEHVIRLRDARGRGFVAKRHRTPERFRRERHAYTTWTAALGDHAPQLLAADPGIQALLLTDLPGVPATALTVDSSTELSIHEDAGKRLRRLHDVQPARTSPSVGPELAERLHRWIDCAAGLLSSRERRILRRHAHALAISIPLETAVCHLDFQPRNWIVRAGAVHLIDFEHARIDARVRDLVRLRYRHWARRPSLQRAFLSGYGRELTNAESRALHHFGAIEAVTSLVRAHRVNAPDLAVHGRAVLGQLE